MLRDLLYQVFDVLGGEVVAYIITASYVAFINIITAAALSTPTTPKIDFFALRLLLVYIIIIIIVLLS